MEEASSGYAIHVGLLWRRQQQVMLSMLVEETIHVGLMWRSSSRLWYRMQQHFGSTPALFLGPALTAASCEVLLKAHVRSIDGQFLNQAVEVVITNYLPFLTACMFQTTRLSSSVVAQAAVQVFGVSVVVGSKFRQSMSSASAIATTRGSKPPVARNSVMV